MTNIAPGKKEEIEEKSNTKTAGHLDAIKERAIQSGLVSMDFFNANPKPYYDRSTIGILSSSPISWYVDTTALDLLQQKTSIRIRATIGMKDFYEMAVKGPGVGFGGKEGHARRHEDEQLTNKFHFDAKAFTNPKSQQLISPAVGEDLHLYFATQVQRDLLGTETTLENGKKSAFEIAFDKIAYIRHDRTSPTGLTTFATLNQIEIEYVNPLQEPKIAERMNLDILSESEVEEALTHVNTTIQDIARRLNIPLTRCTISKGRYGFEELKNQGMLTLPDSSIILDTDGGFRENNVVPLVFPNKDIA